MKRYLTLIAVFFALVAVVDVCCGFGFDYLKSHAKGGETYKHYYIAEKCEADVLILGSSRAARHYVPSIIEDSLGLSCYNAGEPGCGIIPAYAYYKMVAERHKPKLVIYEVTPEYDYFVADDYSKYLGSVKQYKSKEPVRELYSTFGSRYELWKSISNMYEYNSCIINYSLNLIKTSKSNKGFEPLYGQLNPDLISKDDIKKEMSLDSLKCIYFEKLVKDITNNNVRLLIISSPDFYESDELKTNQYEYARYIADKYSVPFLDFSNDYRFIRNYEFFHDDCHLNLNGAEMFTKCIVTDLKNN